MFDWDNTGDALADYAIRVEHVGKERVDVPAGAFEANHFVLTQKTSADTWFKKRAGHITDFWVLDNQVIVRIRRHREPYEVALLDYTVPEKLPGHVSRPSTASRDPKRSTTVEPAGPRPNTAPIGRRLSGKSIRRTHSSNSKASAAIGPKPRRGCPSG